MKCVNCGVELEPGVRFCKECGTKVVTGKKFCRECGSALSEGMKFCSNCGADVNFVCNDDPKDDSQNNNSAFEKSVNSIVSMVNLREKTKNNNTNKAILAIIATGCIVVILGVFLALGTGVNKSNTDKSVANVCFDEITPNVDADATIEIGTEYAYMSDAWDVYIATAVSDNVIKIEHWNKSSQSTKKMKLDEDLGSFKIDEEANGFMWIDAQHTAFTFRLTDKSNSRIKGGKCVVFTIDTSDSDKCKGTNYDDEIACYTYTNDDWHMYRAIALSNNLVKIECWYRSSSGLFSKYLFGWDLGVIDLANTQTDFAWGDDQHTVFSITMRDYDNDSEWKEKKLVSFVLENEKYKYDTVCDFLGIDASVSETNEQSQKNGFDSSTNEVYEMGSYSIEVPTYWTNEVEISDGFQRYAETGEKAVMLQVCCSAETDPDYEVTFDGLMSDNDNMIETIEATAFKEVTGYEVIDTGVAKGILYKGTVETEGITGTGLWFEVPLEADRSWCGILFFQSDNADYLYSDDFMKIILSIKKTNATVVENTEKSETDDSKLTNEQQPESTEEPIEKSTEESIEEPSVILPDSSTKLGKDFDMEGASKVYYINVDGTSNKPQLQEWGAAVVTDGVAEYLDYLESLGCTVTIISSDKKSPYSGYTLYETYFEVENSTVTWDMYLSIQDEDYVEYELDINLP